MEKEKSYIGVGTSFPTKNVAFESVQSTAIGFSLTTAMTYGVIKIFQRIITGNWDLKPQGYDLAISSGIGAFVGGVSGIEKKIRIDAHNDKATFLNRHQDNPELQADLLYGIGGTDFYYKPTDAQKTMKTISDVSFWSWIIADVTTINKPQYGVLPTALMATTILSHLGTMGAKLLGMSNQASKQKEEMSHIEKLIASRENQSAITH